MTDSQLKQIYTYLEGYDNGLIKVNDEYERSFSIRRDLKTK